MDKDTLRHRYRMERMSLSPRERQDREANIRQLISTQLTAQIKTIHIYLPIEKLAEINTMPIVEMLWKEGKTVVVPVVQDKNVMRSFLFTSDTPLKHSRWGIPEPAKQKEVSATEIDMALLPLLAYDRFGNRVGYGRGYYDRFLTEVRPETLKVGLSYFPPEAEKIPQNPWDVPMDLCITPDGIVTFSLP